MEIFGFKITKKVGDKDKVVDKKYKTFAPEKDSSGAQQIVTIGGVQSQFYDFNGTDTVSDRDLIFKYRNAATQPECDMAISDIVDGSIASSENGAPVEIDLEDVDQPSSIKKQIVEEFDNVLRLFKFNRKAEDYFRSWYIDGRIFFHIIIDDKSPSAGIRDLRQLDSLYINKVKELTKTRDPEFNIEVKKVVDEYYVYTEEDSGNAGVKIAKDAIIHGTSGLLDEKQERAISHLHKALKPVNNLRQLEDALVVYRVSRAPERRIFYIDVGNLPKSKAEQYVQNLMSKYRNKLVYDASTGEIKDDTRSMAMLEDFWLPRMEGGRGTEIQTLPGGENLGQIDDVLFFQRKLYRSLNVPVSRLEADSQFSLGRSSEITRDEVKFQKFIDRLRKQFSSILIDALKTQLLLKNVIKPSEWSEIEENISVKFMEDNYFAELKDQEILRERIDMLSSLDEYSGKFFSNKWIRNYILKQSDEDIERIDAEIEDEKEAGEDGVGDPDGAAWG